MRFPQAIALSLIVASLFLTLPSCALRSEQALPKPPANHDERMDWWRDARFGMFLHWGLYAIPAGKWQDRDNHGEWIRTTAQIPRDTYTKFQPQWNPVDFDADEWARMAKDAGMKYIVITSKHHDGFCLFDSAVTDWDVGNTPHGRDIMQELSDACRRHGLKFCTYHSIMDWHHPDYLPRRGWEQDRSTEGADFDRFERYLHAQVTEVIQRYRPAVMWFDGEWETTWTHERGVRLFELCRKLAPEMIVNNRVDVHRQGMQGFSGSTEAVGDFDTPEQEIPATGLPGVDWESCMTMNGHWGWNATDTRWKSDRDLIRNLIDIASKGGNYLLNVGPRADGMFPPQSVARLASIGKWMAVNGEAIGGTTASIFESLPFGRCTIKLDQDTSNGGKTKIYLHVFDWPSNGTLVLPGLANTIDRAYLLSDPSKSLAVGKDGNQSGATVRLPAEAPDAVASVVVVEVLGKATVFRTPRIEAESNQFVTSLRVIVKQETELADLRYTTNNTAPTANSPIMPEVLQLDASVTLQVALFQGDRRVSTIVAQAFEQVRPLGPVKARAFDAGLTLTTATCDWQTIPADRAMFRAAGKTVAVIGSEGPPAEHSAHQYFGFLSIDEDELYRFLLTSDDGSKLWIDGKLVADNDGLHGSLQKLGSIALGKGLHSFELVGFNATGGTELDLKWAKPGQEFAPLPTSALRHNAR
ncbi:MAG: alpha-L-fucosidase [Planctomycetota bacterium]|jgi:alpha-L-fucosidase